MYVCNIVSVHSDHTNTDAYPTDLHIYSCKYILTYISTYIHTYIHIENDCVLLLACDGLWDVLTNEEAVKELHNLYEKGEKQIASFLSSHIHLQFI